MSGARRAVEARAQVDGEGIGEAVSQTYWYPISQHSCAAALDVADSLVDRERSPRLRCTPRSRRGRGRPSPCARAASPAARVVLVDERQRVVDRPQRLLERGRLHGAVRGPLEVAERALGLRARARLQQMLRHLRRAGCRPRSGRFARWRWRRPDAGVGDGATRARRAASGGSARARTSSARRRRAARER